MKRFQHTSRQNIAHLALTIFACICLFWLGLLERDWQWQFMSPLRENLSLESAFIWGQGSTSHGFLNVYSEELNDGTTSVPTNNFRGLDYPPLRLMVFTIWAKWVDDHFPNSRLLSSYEIHEPLLIMNLVMEELSTILIFVIVRYWLTSQSQHNASTIAAISASFFWLNPAISLNSWGWPSWDVWLLPFYLLTLYMVMRDRWSAGGIVMACGVMLKGQIVAVAPIFLLWPLFSGRLLEALRWLGGFAVATALITSPWLITKSITVNGQTDRVFDARAILWILIVTASITCRLFYRFNCPVMLKYTLNIFIASCFIILLVSRDWPSLFLSVLSFVCFWCSFAILPRSIVSACIAIAIALCMFLCCIFYHGTVDWFRVSFIYGSQKFSELTVGYVDNLPAILEVRYHLTIFPHVPVAGRYQDLRYKPTQLIGVEIILSLVYFFSIVICSLGASYLYKRRHPRFLIAVTTPWLLFFTFLPHMHVRYLFWAIGVGSLVVAMDFGTAFLMLILSAISWLMTISDPLLINASIAPMANEKFASAAILGHLILATYPDLGWIVLLITCIFVYLSVKPANVPIDIYYA